MKESVLTLWILRIFQFLLLFLNYWIWGFFCVLRCKRAPDIGLINMVWVKWFNHYTYVLNHITKVLDYYYSSSRSAYFSWASSNRLQANLLLFAPPLKKLSLSSIVFLLHDGGRCSKWKCLSSGTFNSLPVCLLMIFFCWAMCKTIVVSSKFILLLQPLHLVASLNSAGFCACYAHLSHLLALPVLFDR